MNLTLQQQTGRGVEMGYLGSVQDVIDARLPQHLIQKRFRASDIAYGFELATPLDLASMGEAVIVNGICYTASTDQTSEKYNQTIAGSEFIAGGIFLIPKGAKASYSSSWQKMEKVLTFTELYPEIYQQTHSPFVFIGLFDFEELHGIAIGKPPIDGLNIFEHKASYYPIPPVTEKNIHAFVMGVVADEKDETYQRLKGGFDHVLYNNPLDMKATLMHHAHLITLKKEVSSIEQIDEGNVDKTLHLFIEKSKISKFQIQIFTIQNIEDYEEKLWLSQAQNS